MPMRKIPNGSMTKKKEQEEEGEEDEEEDEGENEGEGIWEKGAVGTDTRDAGRTILFLTLFHFFFTRNE